MRWWRNLSDRTQSVLMIVGIVAGVALIYLLGLSTGHWLFDP